MTQNIQQDSCVANEENLSCVMQEAALAAEESQWEKKMAVLRPVCGLERLSPKVTQ